MPIDLDGMETRLKSMKDRKFFIEPGMKITYEDVKMLSELMDKYGSVYFENCIAPFGSNGKNKINLSVEYLCSSCGEQNYTEMGRGAFVKYIKKPTKICIECKSKLDKIRIEEDKKLKETRESLITERTNEYIATYLSPDSRWNAGIKMQDKWSAICNAFYDKTLIYEHVSDMSYYDYLMTPQWKAISEKKRRSAGYKCQLCNTSGKLSVHHKTYEHKGLEMYNMNDLIVLCDDCHKKFHEIEE